MKYRLKQLNKMSHGMYLQGLIDRLYQMDIFVTCNKLLDSYIFVKCWKTFYVYPYMQ